MSALREKLDHLIGQTELEVSENNEANWLATLSCSISGTRRTT